ncbi:hypothetical protein [Ideonella sp. A 288]|uniref:hypothetical protein n=1 Tax=Ideonella sp. A 288 TaxID=1962181 RepID=UPI000B4B46B8|nr:hypothetical protein [Ideonella sp. A 288]
MASALTAEIAIAAAQLVADEGMDYGQAKRKAARALGRTVRPGDLPSNEAVEDEVRAHIALFDADTQPAELAALRRLAQRWMERLAEFRPHLSGGVWRGTANRHSAIHLDLYCDDPKSAEIALLNLGVDFDADLLPNDRGRDLSVLTLADRCPELPHPVTLHLSVRDHDDLRGALKPDARGRSWRGDLDTLRRLLDMPDEPARARPNESTP